MYMLNDMKSMTVHDRHKFWLAVFLCVSGVALLFTGLFVGDNGVITLTGSGELLVTAGAILGIDVAYSNKLQEMIDQMTDKIERGK